MFNQIEFNNDWSNFSKTIDETVKQIFQTKNVNENGESFFENNIHNYMTVVHPLAETLVEKYSSYLVKKEHDQFKKLLQDRLEQGLEWLHFFCNKRKMN